MLEKATALDGRELEQSSRVKIGDSFTCPFCGYKLKAEVDEMHRFSVDGPTVHATWYCDGCLTNLYVTMEPSFIMVWELPDPEMALEQEHNQTPERQAILARLIPKGGTS